MPANIVPVILAGGSGVRLWPVSRETKPKPFLKLGAKRSLLQETARRATLVAGSLGPVIVCNESHRMLAATQLGQIGIEPSHIILEPVVRNTAPAIAVTALLLAEQTPDAQLLVLPADHAIQDNAAFGAAILRASAAAEMGKLVTFGIEPDRPETGYGYILRGDKLDCGEGVFMVASFVEKPDARTAEEYIASGNYFWNSGMFLFPVGLILDELERIKPDLLAICREALRQAKRDAANILLPHEIFERAGTISIDYAVMEHTDKAAVVAANLGWSDIGSWAAIWSLGEKDQHGTVSSGDVVSFDCRRSLLHSEGPLMAAVGLEDIAFIATRDAVAVAPIGRAQDLRRVVDQLTSEGRREAQAHPCSQQEWGSEELLHTDGELSVRRLTMNSGGQLSCAGQSEVFHHLVTLKGSAQIERNGAKELLPQNTSVTIPPESGFDLTNTGETLLEVLEITCRFIRPRANRVE